MYKASSFHDPFKENASFLLYHVEKKVCFSLFLDKNNSPFLIQINKNRQSVYEGEKLCKSTLISRTI
ncbi:hypothetical protein MY9_3636 [Bacillus sp. JS]|nr:hypothetical protein MY9_3636 [Bacillus sp. JS]